jgi:cellulose synthase/poly-beta-1,6-N-acetylglucosamine synthase-like glycosyltransferase
MPANPVEAHHPHNPVVSVIVPARNEEASIGHCLASLTAQSGIDFEIIVVNDNSTDRTPEIARSYPMVEVIDANPLPPGWTGKAHAVHLGYQAAKGRWLLFTDADTVHRHGSLRRAVHEAKQHGAEMLSYSPRQEVYGPWERSVMPIIFAELRRQYPPQLVSDPNSDVVAANGQYILIRREAYEAIGGHKAVRESLLEDVALARLVKRSGRTIRFRYGRDAVKTRMYRSFRQLWEGWTKNLALLFPNPLKLAALCSIECLGMLGGALLFLIGFEWQLWRVALLGLAAALVVGIGFLQRVRKAHFGWINTIISPIGLPIFVLLLVRSRLHYKRDDVTWKGRHYSPSASRPDRSGELLTSDEPIHLSHS